MVAVAQAVPAVVFPEGAALASGIFVLGQRDWAASPGRLVVVVPLAALLGVALARSSLAPWAAELVVLAVVLAGLRLVRSRLAPALSAALIPSVFHVTSWVYPAAVAVVAGSLAGGLLVGHQRRRAGGQGATSRSARSGPGGFPLRGLLAAAAVGGALVLVGGALGRAPEGLIAPPMFVSMLELVAGDQRLPGRWDQRGKLLGARWASMVGAAGLGAMVVGLLGRSWAVLGPLVLAEGLVVAALWWVGLRHPPSAALVLVPLLVRHLDPLGFVAGVAVGGVWLTLAGAVARLWLDHRRGPLEGDPIPS
jgi:hypothetical protein